MTRAVLVLITLLAAPAASAQDPVVVEAHSSLASYEVGEGGRTLRTLRDLGPVAGRGDAEARYLRALAGTEIFVASTVLSDAALRTRLATALSVAEADLEAHLRGELGAASGTYRTGARAALDLLTMLSEWQTEPARLWARRGPHRDALLLLSLAARDDRGTIAPEPCVTGREDASICGFDERSRREIAAAREGLNCARRTARARAEGDPLVVLLAPRVETASAAMTALELHPSIELPEAMGIASAPAGTGAEAALDALVVVAETEVHFRALPVVRIGDGGALVVVRGGGGGSIVAVPEGLPAVPQAIDVLVAGATALGLTAGARVGLAPTAAAPAHMVTRTLLSLARANVAVTHLVATRDDESLAAIPMAATRRSALTEVGARVRVLVGGYGFGVGVRGREARIPRVRTDAGMVFDEAALSARLARGAFDSVALDVMGTVPAGELVRVAFMTATDARRVILLTP